MRGVTGKIVATVEGLQIIVNHKPAKRHGRDRLWVHIRQPKGTDWRNGRAMIYAGAADVEFTREKKGTNLKTPFRSF